MKVSKENNLFVVIPAYNESGRIENVLRDIKKIDVPVIVVDDGSRDSTFEQAKKHDVLVLKHKVNLGKGAAIKTGCEAAISLGADAIVMMDSDGQHKIEDLPNFLEKIKSGNFDVVFGSRNMNLGIPFVRYLGNKLASILVALLFGVYISDLLCGFRAITKKAYTKMKLKSSGYGIETEMVIRTAELKLRYCEIAVETIYYDKFKGVTILNAFGILFNVIKWRFFK